MKPLRCLLLSPTSPYDPPNGDTQYTEDLLSDPPEGVSYVSYPEAIATGELYEGPSFRRPWSLFERPASLAHASVHHALQAARRARWLLPDSVRWFGVSSAFDIVHVHCFPVRMIGESPPVVVSDSAGTWWYWTIGRSMPSDTVQRLLRRERLLSRLLQYAHPTANPDDARAALFFVNAGRMLLDQIGGDAKRIRVCPPGVPSSCRPTKSDGETMLFVARDFYWKGGDRALEIFRRVRAARPAARLVIAGARHEAGMPDGVTFVGPVARSVLYEQVYSSADVFLYPTRFDCAPLVVMEALAHGLPVVAPRHLALPEFVSDGETGFLYEPGDLSMAAERVLSVLSDPPLRARMGARARDDFNERFSIEVRNRMLRSIYESAVA